MRSPFPGMDPYLESPTHWSDFHGRFVPALADAINERLPNNYIARLGERLTVITPVFEPPPGQAYGPDVAVMRRTGPATDTDRGGGTAVATEMEPVTLRNVQQVEEYSEAYIEIRRLPQQDLITVIELLSPTNKYGDGRGEYMSKRRELLRQPVNVVDLDLLRAGVRMEFAEPLPPGHYFALVSRTSRPNVTDAFAWSVRQRLPIIPIPLQSPDPDIKVDLNEPFAMTYERGRYWKVIDYSQPPPPPPFAGADVEWVAEILRGGSQAAGAAKAT